MMTVGARSVAVLCLSGAMASAQTAEAPPDSADVRRRWLALPGFGWTPETGFEVGFTVMSVSQSLRDSLARPTTFTAYVVRSTKAQTRAAIDVDRWLPGNTRRVQATVSAVEYPFAFYGIGDSTTSADEERYVPRWLEGYAQVDQRVRRGTYLVTALRAGYQEVEARSAGLIQGRAVPGSHITRTVIATVGVTYDTRDNVVSTRRGRVWSLVYGRSAPAVGATYDYGRLDAQWRAFRQAKAGHVVAAHAMLSGVDGTVPFDQMPVIGGSRIMRGYGAGRFRDRWVSAVQGEYRSPLWLERLGAVAFAGVGVAAGSLGRLAEGRPFPSIGIGGRLQVDPVQRSALRVDYAIGAYGFGGLYVGFNQAF